MSESSALAAVVPAAAAAEKMQSARTHERAYIGLGANLGDPVAQLRAALAALNRLPATTLVAASPFYRSAPVGYVDQPDFYNAVAAIDTRLAPGPLLAALLEIEREGGRTREFRNAPRRLDLDLLLYGQQIIDEAILTVPHPRMTERAFVLLPLADIAPACIVPGYGALSMLVAAVAEQAIERLALDAPAGNQRIERTGTGACR